MKHTVSTKINEGIVDQNVPPTNRMKLSCQGGRRNKEKIIFVEEILVHFYA